MSPAEMTHEQRLEAFWGKVYQVKGSCWIWVGAGSSYDYGSFPTEHGATAHRFSFFLANGPIPDGLFILHHCDNKRCVNPAHLYAGGPKENREDHVAKILGKPRRVAVNALPQERIREIIGECYKPKPRKPFTGIYRTRVTDHAFCLVQMMAKELDVTPSEVVEAAIRDRAKKLGIRVDG